MGGVDATTPTPTTSTTVGRGGQAAHQFCIALSVHHAIARAQLVGAVEEDPLAALGLRLAQHHCSGVGVGGRGIRWEWLARGWEWACAHQAWVGMPRVLMPRTRRVLGCRGEQTEERGRGEACAAAHRTRERSTQWRRPPLRWPSAARGPARVGAAPGVVDGRRVGEVGHRRAGQGTCTPPRMSGSSATWGVQGSAVWCWGSPSIAHLEGLRGGGLVVAPARLLLPDAVDLQVLWHRVVRPPPTGVDQNGGRGPRLRVIKRDRAE